MLTSTDVVRIKTQITNLLKKNAGMSPAQVTGILPVKDLQGKLYEAHVLSVIIENLATQEKCTIKLVNTGKLMLKQKGSPLNRTYPYFEVWKGGSLIGEIFTDTEFTSLSCSLRKAKVSNGDYHELDIGLFTPGCMDGKRPSYNEVLLAVECKATVFEKSIFREVLGFRRELSMLKNKHKTIFNVWPIDEVPAVPSSVHLCYSTDGAIRRYSDNAIEFGILMIHETM